MCLFRKTFLVNPSPTDSPRSLCLLYFYCIALCSRVCCPAVWRVPAQLSDGFIVLQSCFSHVNRYFLSLLVSQDTASSQQHLNVYVLCRLVLPLCDFIAYVQDVMIKKNHLGCLLFQTFLLLWSSHVGSWPQNKLVQSCLWTGLCVTHLGLVCGVWQGAVGMPGVGIVFLIGGWFLFLADGMYMLFFKGRRWSTEMYVYFMCIYVQG